MQEAIVLEANLQYNPGRKIKTRTHKASIHKLSDEEVPGQKDKANGRTPELCKQKYLNIADIVFS